MKKAKRGSTVIVEGKRVVLFRSPQKAIHGKFILFFYDEEMKARLAYVSEVVVAE